MHRKEGQVALFLVIVLVILFSAILFYTIFPQKIAQEFETEVERAQETSGSPVRSFVEACIQSSLTDGVEFVSRQGGYVLVPEPFFETVTERIPYYINDAVVTVPTITDIERELSLYVTTELPFCIQNFAAFPEFTITAQDDIQAKVAIREGGVTATLSYSLKIRRDDKIQQLDSFFVSADGIALKKMHAMSSFIVSEAYDAEDGLCITCIYDKALEDDLEVTITDVDETTTIVDIANEEIPSLYSFGIGVAP